MIGSIKLQLFQDANSLHYLVQRQYYCSFTTSTSELVVLDIFGIIIYWIVFGCGKDAVYTIPNPQPFS